MERPGDRIGARRREIARYKRDQEALADDIGVSRQQVSRWENGLAMPTGENLSALARALGVTPDWILHGDSPSETAAAGARLLGERPVNQYGSSDHPEQGGQAAEQLIDYLSNRVGMRRVAGELTDKDLIAAAYTLARKYGFGTEDYRRLDAWRDQIIQSEKS